MQEVGFEDASETSVPAILAQIHPKGGTAMRDSLINGCSLLIKLYEILMKTSSDIANNYNFVHVVLTDGID
jgi:hypothetical protein